jgi:hypothetical protein
MKKYGLSMLPTTSSNVRSMAVENGAVFQDSEMRYISASGDALVWGIAPNDSLYMCKKPCTEGDWKYVGGSFKQVDGWENSVIGVTTDGSILFMSLEQMEGNL